MPAAFNDRRGGTVFQDAPYGILADEHWRHLTEQAKQKLEQARRDAIDAEDAYCEANAVFRESEEKLAEAKDIVLKLEQALAEAVTRLNDDEA